MHEEPEFTWNLQKNWVWQCAHNPSSIQQSGGRVNLGQHPTDPMPSSKASDTVTFLSQGQRKKAVASSCKTSSVVKDKEARLWLDCEVSVI